MAKLAYSVKEAGDLIGVGPDAMRNAIRRGDIAAVHLGGKILVPHRELERLLGIEPDVQPTNLQVVEAVAELLGIDIDTIPVRRAS